MARQLPTPPPYMWERIEKILDDQDQARHETNKLITDTFKRARTARNFNFLVSAIAGISLLTFVILNYSGTVKQV
jgi:hypothetical protein